MSNESRAKRLIESCIRSLEIDLSGTHVLTEAGSGPFVYSALIAAMAGASQVSVVCPDSPYAKSADVTSRLTALSQSFGVRSGVIQVYNVREALRPAVDIVLNLGFVRPVDGLITNLCSEGAVVSYMCEKWEHREGDIDLALLASKGIPIAGVNEDFRDFGVFSSCGQLALKLLFEAGAEVAGSNVVLVSDNPFGAVIDRALRANAARCQVRAPRRVLEESLLKEADVILLADYSDSIDIFPAAWIPQIKEVNPGVKIVSFSGCYPVAEYLAEGFDCYPDYSVPPKRMFKTLSHLGDGVVIKLHALGVKVGELLYRKKKFGQDFADYGSLVQEF